ncbi:hypothetical protein ACOSQ3_031098 [Xanthoceras sorbifolium]
MTSTKEEILNFPVEIEEGKKISIQVKLRTSKKRSKVHIIISTPKAKKNKRNQSSDPEHQENESRYATIKTSTNVASEEEIQNFDKDAEEMFEKNRKYIKIYGREQYNKKQTEAQFE